MLDAEEVVAGGDAGGDLHGDGEFSYVEASSALTDADETFRGRGRGERREIER